MSCSSWRLDASAVVSVSAGAGPCVGAVYYKQICKSDWAISRLTGGYIKCTLGLQPPIFFCFSAAVQDSVYIQPLSVIKRVQNELYLV